MKLYFDYSKIPELKGFDAHSRSSLIQLAIQNLKADKGRLIVCVPAIAGVLGAGIGAFIFFITVVLLWPTFPTVWVEHQLLRNYLVFVPGAILVGGFMGFMGKQFLIAQLRPYLRKLIADK